ncbi:MAG: hypothetical protein MJ187_04440 [Alphaproteobacteria bacterium]|nr:hypothetical protein [Alphaproteobacteria bacterium]
MANRFSKQLTNLDVAIKNLKRDKEQSDEKIIGGFFPKTMVLVGATGGCALAATGCGAPVVIGYMVGSAMIAAGSIVYERFQNKKKFGTEIQKNIEKKQSLLIARERANARGMQLNFVNGRENVNISSGVINGDTWFYDRRVEKADRGIAHMDWHAETKIAINRSEKIIGVLNKLEQTSNKNRIKSVIEETPDLSYDDKKLLCELTGVEKRQKHEKILPNNVARTIERLKYEIEDNKKLVRALEKDWKQRNR